MANIREELEIREAESLARYASLSCQSERDFKEEPDAFRTSFQVDRDRILPAFKEEDAGYYNCFCRRIGPL